MKSNILNFTAGIGFSVILAVIVIVVLIMTSVMTVNDFSFKNVRMFFDDTEMFFYDFEGNTIETVWHNGLVYVPVEAFARNMGYDYFTDEETNTVYLSENTNPWFNGTFYDMFIAAGTVNTVGFMKTEDEYPGYTELVFSLVEDENDTIIEVTVNKKVANNDIGEAVFYNLISKYKMKMYENQMFYRHYGNINVEDGTSADGLVLFTFTESGIIKVEEFGNTGFSDGISIAGEYKISGLG